MRVFFFQSKKNQKKNLKKIKKIENPKVITVQHVLSLSRMDTYAIYLLFFLLSGQNYTLTDFNL